MGTTIRRTALPLAFAATLLAPGLARAAFECPVKAPVATRPLPGDLGRNLKPYDDPRADPSLKSDIASMKSEGMPSGEIVDHVVASYCPTVGGIPDLSDADRNGLVQRFASELAQVVYATGTGTVDAILLDVPVPPDLYAKVGEAAEQHKETRDAFALAALREAAGSP